MKTKNLSSRMRGALILILALAVALAVSGCGKKQPPELIANNNTQSVNQNVNTNTNTSSQNGGGEEIEVWPDVSFAEEDYEGWKTYINTELGYSIKYPADWTVEEYQNLAKEVVINPLNHKPFLVYIDIGIDDRELESIRKMNTEVTPDGAETQIIFAGQKAYQFTSYVKDSRDICIPYNLKTYYIIIGKDQDQLVQQALASFKFID